MENKRKIISKLLPALQKTRAGKDLIAIGIDKKEEWVTLYFSSHKSTVNVECDSGAAMILDIVKALM